MACLILDYGTKVMCRFVQGRWSTQACPAPFILPSPSLPPHPTSPPPVFSSSCLMLRYRMHILASLLPVWTLPCILGLRANPFLHPCKPVPETVQHFIIIIIVQCHAFRVHKPMDGPEDGPMIMSSQRRRQIAYRGSRRYVAEMSC